MLESPPNNHISFVHSGSVLPNQFLDKSLIQPIISSTRLDRRKIEIFKIIMSCVWCMFELNNIKSTHAGCSNTRAILSVVPNFVPLSEDKIYPM